MRNTFWYLLGGFALYEVIAWQINNQRYAAYLRTPGLGYSPLPFDLLGKVLGTTAANPAGTNTAFNAMNYPGIAPAAAPGSFAAAISDPAAARAAAFDAGTYPGVAPMRQFDPNDPLGLNNPLIVF